ncbi:MAG: hypothetical protein ACE15E_12540 [Acidobacteriota bacterium]
MSTEAGFEKCVFINCPFDQDFKPLLRAILFTVIECGLEPRIASERADSAEIRLQKIVDLIRTCRLSIHDLSRMKAARKGALARFNMPFELGIDFGCRIFGGEDLGHKQILVLERERYRYQKALSDISGNDIEAHDNDPETLIRKLRNWLCTTLGCDLPAGTVIWYRFTDFLTSVQLQLEGAGYSLRDIDEMPTAEFIRKIRAWRDASLEQ